MIGSELVVVPSWEAAVATLVRSRQSSASFPYSLWFQQHLVGTEYRNRSMLRG